MKYFSALLVLLAPQSDPAPEVTFTKDIAPFLYRSCTTCHRPGEIAPFPLVTYEDARKRAKQILRVVEARVMPPWKPEPGHGEFVEARRLADDQVALLKKWVDSDAREGRAADLPPLPKYPAGWRLGEPDLVLKMPEKFTIPAEGPDIYMHFVYSIAVEGDRYVRGIEVRPGNPRVAHHAIGLMDASGVARKLDAQHPGPGYPSFGGPGFFPIGFTPGYVPGQTPRFIEDDTAVVLKKGTDFVIQMHYHPTGKVETDQTEVGIFFTEQKPRRPLTGVLLGSEDIDIAAGEKGYRRTDSITLPVELEARSIWAHMHYVGRSARIWAELPDGSTRPLLKISDWDFNWQDIYRYAAPIKLPKGTKVRMEYEYDNSSDNPRNPSNPPRRVQFGEMSTDEMAGLWLGGVVDNPQQEAALGWANFAHYLQITTQGKKNRKP